MEGISIPKKITHYLGQVWIIKAINQREAIQLIQFQKNYDGVLLIFQFDCLTWSVHKKYELSNVPTFWLLFSGYFLMRLHQDII